MSKIEVFTASCPICKETLELVERVKCEKCTLTEYNLYEKCADRTCLELARHYGVKQVPTVVVDGEVAIRGKPTEAQLRHYLKL
jgi:glutaredoxin